MADSIFTYEISPQAYVRLSSCGRLDLVAPTPQARRIKECFVAYVVLKGELFLTDYLPNGPERFHVRAGETHIIAPGLFQESTAPSLPGTRMLWIHFDFVGEPKIRYLDRKETAAMLYSCNPKAPMPWLIPRHLHLGRELDNLLQLHSELNDHVRLFGVDNTSTHQICGHIISLLFRALAQRVLDADASGDVSPQQAHVERARNFIRMNYDKNISLAEVAASLELNPSYLSRCFQRVTQESVVDFLLRTRIEAAKELLAEQSLPSVKEVAFQTGFSSPIYFCRIFRRLERKTAMEYVASVRGESGRRASPKTSQQR